MSAKKRKIIKIFVAVIIALGVLFALSLLLEGVLKRSNSADYDYEFYTPMEDEEYLTDPAYLSKDRTLHYTDAMGQTWYIDEDSTCTDIGAVFFQLYFLALEEGDCYALNALYRDGLGEYGEFTPQRVYARELVYLYDDKVDDSTFSITYSLDYNIMKNDGSFRRDIGSDMSRTQYVTLYYNSEEAWIEEVKTEFRK